MKNKLIEEFKKLNINIISKKKLEEYINFCLEKNQNKNIVGATSHHHILPNKLFPEYSDLNENQWNGTYLLYADHYYAHWLITEAIDSHSQLYAFCAMHYKDFTLGRIKECDLLKPDIIHEKMKQRNILVSENNKRRSEEGTLFNGYVYCRETAKNKRNKTLSENPELVERMNNNHKLTINDENWKNTTGKEKVRKWKENRLNNDKYDENRVVKFLESFNQTKQPDKYKQNKFRSDVAQSKINKITIYNKYNEVMFCIPYLFGRFCKENNLPGCALFNTIKTKRPLYSTNYLLQKAKLKGYDKYEGWYATMYTPEMV